MRRERGWIGQYANRAKAFAPHQNFGPAISEAAEPRLALSNCRIPLAGLRRSLASVELWARLKAEGRDEAFEQEWEDHLPLFEQIISVDFPLCLKAIELRRAATARLPTIDSLIAAAAEHDAVLVHRDPHFKSIPGHLLKQELLPEK